MSTGSPASPSLTGDGSSLSNSFKRPYDQLDSEIDSADDLPSSSASGGERHKRARSEPRSEPGSSGTVVADQDNFLSTLEQLSNVPGPSQVNTSDAESVADRPNQYEMSMERFHTFQEQLRPLRETPEFREHRAQTANEEDEIMDQLFGGPGSSQPVVVNRGPQPDIPSPSAEQDVPHYSRVGELLPGTSSAIAQPVTPEREILVISDSDDEVQIIERPIQRPPSSGVSESAVDSRVSSTPASPWDLSAIQNPWEDIVQATPPASSSHSVPTSRRYEPAPPTSNLPTDRRTRLSSISEAEGDLDLLSAWQATSDQHVPDTSMSASMVEEEQRGQDYENLRLQRLDELRRRAHERSHEVIDRATQVEAALRRLRDMDEQRAHSVRPSSSGTRPDHTSRRHMHSGSSESGSAQFTPEGMRHFLRGVSTRPSRPAAPSTTFRTVERSSRNSDASAPEQRRHSLVMEGILNENPELLNILRPTSRRATPSLVSRQSATASSLASRPASPQTTRQDDQSVRRRGGDSRAPSWLLSTSPPSEVRTEDNSLSPSNSNSSMASFVTASSSFDEPVPSNIPTSSSSSRAHVPAVASPLREVFVSPAESALRTPSVRRSPDDRMSVAGADLEDIASRVQSLSCLLADMASTVHASPAIRAAAADLVTSGQALMRAIDEQRQSGASGEYLGSGGSERPLSTVGPPARSNRISSEVLDISAHSHQLTEPGRSRSSFTQPNFSLASSGERNTRFASMTPDPLSLQRLFNRSNTSPRSSVERPASVGSISTTRLRETVQWPASAFDDSEMRPAEASLFERLERARSNRSNNDRWTQARERRRELENALLAEEFRMPVLRRGSRRDRQPLGDTGRTAQPDSSRMAVDSEDELQALLDSGGTRNQNPMDVGSDVEISSDPHISTSRLTGSGSNNATSRTAAGPSAQERGYSESIWSELPNSRRPARPTTTHPVFDLNAFHDGPFRDALARVGGGRQVENRSQQPRTLAAQRSSAARVTDARGTNATPFSAQALRAQSTSNSSVSNTVPSSSSDNHLLRDRPSSSTWADLESFRGMEELEDDFIQLQRLRRQLPSLNSPTRPLYPTNPPSRYGTHTQTRERVRQAMTGVSTSVASSGNGIGAAGRHYTLPNNIVDISDATLRQLILANTDRYSTRGVPQNTIESLEKGTFGEWANADTETQCPICFEDYEASDAVLRLPNCKHWFHKPCIEEWFKSASTCPICRERVGSVNSSSLFSRGRPRRTPISHPIRPEMATVNGERPSVLSGPSRSAAFLSPLRVMGIESSADFPSSTASRDTSRQMRGAAWREVHQRGRLPEIPDPFVEDSRWGLFSEYGSRTRRPAAPGRATEQRTDTDSSAPPSDGDNGQRGGQASRASESGTDTARSQERHNSQQNPWWDLEDDVGPWL